MKNQNFTPNWLEREANQQSFRSIFKWGAKDQFKNPSHGFLNVIKKELGLSDANFQAPVNSGGTIVEDTRKTTMLLEDIQQFEKIVGQENIFF